MASETKRRYSSEADPTRERILKAALECMSRTAIGGLSVRAIAAAAGVNVATAHYYFRTKDALVSEALGLFFAPVLARFASMEGAEGSARERLEGFLRFYLEQFHEHPGVFTSIIEAMIASNIRKDSSAGTACERVLLDVIRAGKDRLLSLVREVSGIRDPGLLALRTLQVMAGAIHPILVSTLPLSLFGVDFGKADTRRSYVTALVDSLGASEL
jgi:AcrR family transcriptional regulator